MSVSPLSTSLFIIIVHSSFMVFFTMNNTSRFRDGLRSVYFLLEIHSKGLKFLAGLDRNNVVPGPLCLSVALLHCGGICQSLSL